MTRIRDWIVVLLNSVDILPWSESSFDRDINTIEPLCDGMDLVTGGINRLQTEFEWDHE